MDSFALPAAVLVKLNPHISAFHSAVHSASGDLIFRASPYYQHMLNDHVLSTFSRGDSARAAATGTSKTGVSQGQMETRETGNRLRRRSRRLVSSVDDGKEAGGHGETGANIYGYQTRGKSSSTNTSISEQRESRRLDQVKQTIV